MKKKSDVKKPVVSHKFLENFNGQLKSCYYLEKNIAHLKSPEHRK